MTTDITQAAPRAVISSAARVRAAIALSIRSPGAFLPTVGAVRTWLGDASREMFTDTEQTPLERLPGWHAEPGATAIRHHTGAFFSIEGISVRMRSGLPGAGETCWAQPIINQPEVGVLGILVREFDGVLHCLMQAKAEPGNHNGVQLSPTVQATRSNYTRRHGGTAVPYLEYFMPETSIPGRRVISDVRQSEQGSRFLGKRNRNVVVQVSGDLPVLPGFAWFTVGQLHQLMAIDDVVNMDARTVLSCLPFPGAELLEYETGGVDWLLAGWIRESSSGGDEFLLAPRTAGPPRDDGFRSSLLRSCDARTGSLHSTDEILLWVSDVRTRVDLDVTRVPLSELPGWRRTDGRISHESGAFFDVVGVNVQAGGREVGSWSQPMIAGHGLGLVAFLVTRIDGVLHALVQLRAEPGLVDVAELAPTVQCTPHNYDRLPGARRPEFLDLVQSADPSSVRYDAVQSVEGGRFYHTRYRHVVLETDRLPEPPDHRWMALHQLTDLARHSHYINEQARSLLACLRALVGSGN